MSINVTPYLGEPPTATHQPSKRHVFEFFAQQSNVFRATNDQLDNHAKPSSLRRRTEVVHASNEPSGSNGNSETRVSDENLRRQVEELMVENEALREDAIPPPYTNAI